ncbi:MAG: thymidine kinase [Gemmatimonadetes bacterium]|nr:thymidine kinase [Gemmatimonadota bacterium]HPF61277.1 thymidine kinase [Gemmatimonadales bacterium]HRX17551.1 thymidine kinase [Gemmatimonadales bacterium]
MTQQRLGRLEVVAGVMFSGKSEELIRRVRRAVIARRNVRVFKSHLDARYEGLQRVSSHTGVTIEAVPIDRSDEILRRLEDLQRVDVVAVDEVQFLDAGIVEVATHLAESGIRVICAGTDTDFRGEPFGMMGHLMAIAEDVTKLQAICVVCGDLACRNQRLVDGHPAAWDMPVVMVGGTESYEARCRRCFVMPRRDEDQVKLL